MNGRAIPGAYLFRSVCVFRLTNVIPERIIFVSRGITVLKKQHRPLYVNQCETDQTNGQEGKGE